MKAFFTGSALAGVLLLGSASLPAQQPVVVQLPSYSVFSVSTTVVVPTGGYTHLGSVSRSAWGASQFGFHPLRNRAFGQSTSHRGMGVRVWVHDLHQMDRRLLRQAGAPQRGSPWAATPRGNAAGSGRSASQARKDDPFADQFSRTMREDRRVGGSLAQLKARRRMAATPRGKR